MLADGAAEVIDPAVLVLFMMLVRTRVAGQDGDAANTYNRSDDPANGCPIKDATQGTET